MTNLQANDSIDTERKHYSAPKILLLGSVSSLTLGNGGSTIDGTYTFTQTGGGNDDKIGPHDGG